MLEAHFQSAGKLDEYVQRHLEFTPSMDSPESFEILLGSLELATLYQELTIKKKDDKYKEFFSKVFLSPRETFPIFYGEYLSCTVVYDDEVGAYAFILTDRGVEEASVVEYLQSADDEMIDDVGLVDTLYSILEDCMHMDADDLPAMIDPDTV